jgi:hypothetical protein
MKRIETLSSIEGRKLLREIFHELKYRKQLSGISALLLCWRICVSEREIFRYVKKEITVLHPLGIFAGTALWMEEIVNRFYFSTINSFVYFGAAILLTLIGVRRFSDHISEPMIIAGVAFEATMLIMIFIVMLFSPNDEIEDLPNEDTNGETDTVQELLLEVGEIGRDFAAVVVQLEKLSESYILIADLQKNMIDKLANIADNTSAAIAPNPQMLETMRETNLLLSEFKNTVEKLNISAESLKHEEIETSVRKEVERILVNKLSQ